MMAFPEYVVALHIAFAYFAVFVCCISLVAIQRTRKTPYSTKILSIGLLVYDSLFLICSSTAKMFKYTDAFIIQQSARGFQISSNLIILGMALERLFVLNWPYIYLKVATKHRTRIVCFGVIFFAALQYIAVRGLGCYARSRFVDCGLVLQIYFVSIAFIVPILSFIAYYKIYTIVRQKGSEHSFKYRPTQYKGTIVSFVYLINATLSMLTFLGLAIFYAMRTSKGVKEDGLVGMWTDSLNIINCIADPLIYVIYFREARLEILKMLALVCPFQIPKIETMRMEIFNIMTSSSKT